MNEFLKENNFLNLLKIAEISHVLKNINSSSKKNYHPISTSSNFTIRFSQVNEYMVNKIANYPIGSEKSCNTPNSLIRIIEFWTTKLNNRSKI